MDRSLERALQPAAREGGHDEAPKVQAHKRGAVGEADHDVVSPVDRQPAFDRPGPEESSVSEITDSAARGTPPDLGHRRMVYSPIGSMMM